MATNLSKSKPTPENYYLISLSAIKTNISHIEQESYFSTTQRLNVIYWKIGEILFPQKRWPLENLKNLAQDLSNLYPHLPLFSETLLRETIQFYSTYHNYPIISQQLKKSHIHELSAGKFLCLLLRHVFKPSKPLTNIKLVQKLLIFNLPWQQNSILLKQKYRLNADDKLWYAKKALSWNCDDQTLKTWLRHKLITHTGGEDDDTKCPNARFLSSYCEDCRSIGHNCGLSTWSAATWIFIIGLILTSWLSFKHQHGRWI